MSDKAAGKEPMTTRSGKSVGLGSADGSGAFQLSQDAQPSTAAPLAAQPKRRTILQWRQISILQQRRLILLLVPLLRQQQRGWKLTLVYRDLMNRQSILSQLLASQN